MSKVRKTRPSQLARSSTRTPPTVAKAARSLSGVGKPLLHIEQRPDEKAAILLAIEMLVDQRLDGVAVEQPVEAGIVVEQGLLDEVDALALEPGRVGRGKALLLGAGDLLGDEALHHVAQDLLAVLGL